MVVILTGYADLDSAIDALRLGADDFLQKPCDIDELLCRISNCFVKQELQRQVAFYEKILPVCAYCRKIRDDRQGEPGEGNWYILEEYFKTVKGVNVSHGCCPECFSKEMSDDSWRRLVPGAPDVLGTDVKKGVFFIFINSLFNLYFQAACYDLSLT